MTVPVIKMLTDMHGKTTDPIRALVQGMEVDDKLRILRRASGVARLERLAELDADTAADVDTLRSRFGCGEYVVRVMRPRRRNGNRPNGLDQLVIRSSQIVKVTREQRDRS